MSKLRQISIMIWLIDSSLLISQQPTSQENNKHQNRATEYRFLKEN